MKWMVISAAGIGLALACTTQVYTARYDLALVDVERRQGSDVQRFVTNHGRTFEDDFVKITCTPAETQLGVIVVNKTDSPQTIHWDQVKYDWEGVVHETADASTTIAPGSMLLEFIEPRSHASARATSASIHQPLFPVTTASSESAVRRKIQRGSVRVVLPVGARAYTLNFDVKGDVVHRGWSS